MEAYRRRVEEGKAVFVGVDLHRFKWHVTVRAEGEELFSGTIPVHWEALRRLLDRWRGCSVWVVYEAGYFGFWFYDRVVEYGADCTVTPPSLLPQEYGNRVKTDSRDSRKLSYLLAKGMLRRVWVLSQQERYHRQVVRRRRQLIGDRVRVQNRIKSELQFYGIELVGPRAPSLCGEAVVHSFW
jgi:transposase